MQKKARLKVAEIYKTIHGELPRQGMPVTVLRLSGCRSACTWCDSRRFWEESGRLLSSREIFKQLRGVGLKEILVTGGEPLNQPATPGFLGELIEKGYQVTLETDGSFSLKRVPRGVVIVMDLKTPGSRAKRKSLISNFQFLKKQDLLKIVVGSKNDYSWASDILMKNRGRIGCGVVFSPVFCGKSAKYGKISPRALAKMLLKDNSPYRMQIQLHRILGLK